ncbi:hypothetical protein HYV11_00550 [Candidatus Dependentiae bacterium]|nr:hypothetical protein [Candidatus Dependentiae bacterium]
MNPMNQLIDIYNIHYVSWWSFKYSIIFIIIFCIIVSYFFWRWYIKNQLISYEQATLLQLQNLHKKEYETEQEIFDAYFQISKLMRNFLSRRYNITLLNKTDVENIDEVRSFVPFSIFTALEDFFRRAYQIKFAQTPISAEKLYTDIDSLQFIIYEILKQKQDVRD